ncbi:hypothetical protein KCP77_06535 [Salmonella enterica subsp. enterica]|nr:hypothetical protein KCP77_06535 [Salmonella enterica subsp. enterica]
MNMPGGECALSGLHCSVSPGSVAPPALTITAPGRYKPDAPPQSPPARTFCLTSDADFPLFVLSCAIVVAPSNVLATKRLAANKGQRHLRRIKIVTLHIST